MNKRKEGRNIKDENEEAAKLDGEIKKKREGGGG